MTISVCSAGGACAVGGGVRGRAGRTRGAASRPSGRARGGSRALQTLCRGGGREGAYAERGVVDRGEYYEEGDVRGGGGLFGRMGGIFGSRVDADVGYEGVQGDRAGEYGYDDEEDSEEGQGGLGGVSEEALAAALEMDQVDPRFHVLKMEPEHFEDIWDVAMMALRERRSIILSTMKMDPVSAQRAVDFLAGGTQILFGHVERLGDGLFLFAPSTSRVKIFGAPEEVDLPGRPSLFAFGKKGKARGKRSGGGTSITSRKVRDVYEDDF